MKWFLESEMRRRFEAAEESGFLPTADQQRQVAEAFDGGVVDLSGTPLMVKADNVAEINVVGVLTNRPDFLAFLIGGGNTTYTELAGALRSADADPSVERIVMNIDSPGGSVAGFFDFIQVMRQVETEIVARSGTLVASAAYGIASQADRIEATNVGAMFGSVGVVITDYVDESEVTVTSTEAPEKRPDISTEEGVASVRRHLDAVHEKFAGAIAQGRNTTLENVNANFGRGAVLLAEEAEARGMIDCVAECSSRMNSSNATSTEVTTLTLEELQAQHPELYTQAVKTGETQERDRVTAHLVAGEACGDLSIAVKAIKDGADMSQTLNAEYLAASMRKEDISDRAGDEADLEDATEGDVDATAGDSQSPKEALESSILEKFNAIAGAKQ